MSFEGRIYQDLTTDEGSRSRHQTFGQGLFAERGRFSIPHHRLVILGLGLLNAALLVAAAVIGIYCANAKDIQISNFAATPLILEMNFLRNHSEIIKVKAEAQAALAKERSEFVHLMLDVKEKKIITDRLEKQIWILQAEKSSLQSNKTALERNCNRCPPEWNILKTSCYYFSQNEAASKKTWSDSRADCNSKGGDLLVIDSLEEQQLIIDYFQRMGSSSTSGISSTSSISSTGSFSSLRGIGSFSSIGTGIAWLPNGYWIGLTNVHQGTWAWINNVTEESTMHWRPGQPSSSGAQSGNCAAFIYVSSANSLYNENCQHQLNWICEMKPSSI